jgi:hypothetical protein
MPARAGCLNVSVTICGTKVRIARRHDAQSISLSVESVLLLDMAMGEAFAVARQVPRGASLSGAFEAVHAAARGELRCSPRIAGFRAADSSFAPRAGRARIAGQTRVRLNRKNRIFRLR